MLHEAYRRLAQRIFTVHDGDASITFTSGNATAIGLNHKALGYLYRRSIEYKYCYADNEGGDEQCPVNDIQIVDADTAAGLSEDYV